VAEEEGALVAVPEVAQKTLAELGLPPVPVIRHVAVEEYEKACLAAGATLPNRPSEQATVSEGPEPGGTWRARVQRRRLPEPDMPPLDWTEELVAKHDEVPIKFRETEDLLLNFQDALVEEVRQRQDADLELESSIKQLDNRWADVETGILDSNVTQRETDFEQCRVECEERWEKMTTDTLESLSFSIRGWDANDFEEKLKEESDEYNRQLAEEAALREAAKTDFETKLQSRYDGITDLLLENRRERIRVPPAPRPCCITRVTPIPFFFPCRPLFP